MPSQARRTYDRHWVRLVALVLERDGRVCHRCGKPGADTGGHVVAIVNGGARLDPANVKAEHAHCNYADGARIGNARRRARALNTSQDW